MKKLKGMLESISFEYICYFCDKKLRDSDVKDHCCLLETYTIKDQSLKVLVSVLYICIFYKSDLLR